MPGKEGSRRVIVELLLHEYVNPETNDVPWTREMVIKWLIDYLPPLKDGGLMHVRSVEFPDGQYTDLDDEEWTLD